MLRNVQPELLDSLDPSDPDARANRRDLFTINRLMGNFRWFQSMLGSGSATGCRAVELGAGGGELGRHLHRAHTFLSYTAVDLIPPPADWPREAQWWQGDLLQYRHLDTTDLLLANLILHHFTDEELATLGARIRRSGIRHILVSEPCRRPIHKWQLRAGCLIGFNPVTLYDGCVSIDSGFREQELPAKLGLSQSEWHWSVQTTLMGAYRLAATRRGAEPPLPGAPPPNPGAECGR